VGARLTGQLICYGRNVVHEEWPLAEEGRLGDRLNPWGVALFETIQTARLTTAARQSAYDRWLEQTSERESARIDRIHGAVGVIPTPLWVVLFFISGVIFIYLLFFADSGEGAVTQAVLMGSVASVIVAMLLLIRFLDSPFHEGVGGVHPVAMERTLRMVDEAIEATGTRVAVPCDERGNPSS
jgi:hypothetical protein